VLDSGQRLAFLFIHIFVLRLLHPQGCGKCGKTIQPHWESMFVDFRIVEKLWKNDLNFPPSIYT
jgi:hypothetical protein